MTQSCHHHRAERLGEEIRELLSEIVSGMGDPRIGLATVTGARLSPDLRHARVLVSVMGDEREQEQSLRRLEAARGYLRHQLALELATRFTPELHFELDRSLEYSSRVEDLLRRANKQK
jgi:ribosome-binding factor A